MLQIKFCQQLPAYKKSKLVEDDHFALLVDKNVVIDRVQMMIKNVEKEFDAVSSANELFKVFPSPFVGKSLENLSKKGVKIRVILELEEPTRVVIRRAGNCFEGKTHVDLKHTHTPSSHYIISDHKQVLLATSREPSIGKLPYL